MIQQMEKDDDTPVVKGAGGVCMYTFMFVFQSLNTNYNTSHTSTIQLYSVRYENHINPKCVE